MFLQTVAAIWIVAVIIPGPNFMATARCALSGSRSSALGCVAGIASGTLCWSLSGWLGVSALFSTVPVAYFALKTAGGLYLTWLGARLLWSARTAEPEWKTQSEKLAVDRISAFRAWRLGLITNLANPKSALFVASVFASALPHDASWTHGLAAVALMVTISSIWYGLVAVMLNSGPVASRYRKARRSIDAAAGVLFVAFGIKLMMASRS